MYRIALPCSHQFAVRFHWSPGTISFAIDQMVPYCPRDTYLQRDIERITKKIIKGAHGYRRRDEIEQWVISNHRTSNEFLLGESTAFWWMVAIGV
jgi:hypothetical protein